MFTCSEMAPFPLAAAYAEAKFAFFYMHGAWGRPTANVKGLFECELVIVGGRDAASTRNIQQGQVLTCLRILLACLVKLHKTRPFLDRLVAAAQTIRLRLAHLDETLSNTPRGLSV